MKYILTLLLTATFVNLYSQKYFTGEITYKFEIAPKSDTVDIESLLKNEPGTSSTYLITDGYYKSTYYKDGKFTYSYTYHEDSKFMYDNNVDKPYITYRDSRKGNAEYSEPQIFRDSTIEVLGYECFTVITEADYGTKTNYYADALKVNYHSFEGHEVGNWYRQMQVVSGSLSLKTIIEYPAYFTIQTVVDINHRPVSREEFNLPDSKPIAASYSALDKQVEMIQPTQEQINCYQDKLASASNSENREDVIVYVSFVVTNDGDIKFIRPFEQDEYGFDQIAVDIVENCDFLFKPGQIEGINVDSEAYLPVKFVR